MKMHKGVTLLELLVAISLSAIILAGVFYAWRFIEQHTIVQSRKAVFYSEANRISQSIAGEIRKCRQVIMVSDHSIVFTKNPSGDTVNFEFQGSQLTRNGAPVSINAPASRFADFLVLKNQESYNDKNADLLLDIIIGIADNFGDSSSITTSCAVSYDAAGYSHF